MNEKTIRLGWHGIILTDAEYAEIEQIRVGRKKVDDERGRLFDSFSAQFGARPLDLIIRPCDKNGKHDVFLMFEKLAEVQAVYALPRESVSETIASLLGNARTLVSIEAVDWVSIDSFDRHVIHKTCNLISAEMARFFAEKYCASKYFTLTVFETSVYLFLQPDSMIATFDTDEIRHELSKLQAELVLAHDKYGYFSRREPAKVVVDSLQKFMTTYQGQFQYYWKDNI